MLYSRNWPRSVTLFLLSLFLMSCGGSEGGGSIRDGSLTISTDTMTFIMFVGGSAPADQFITYSSSNPDATQALLGVPVNDVLPSWLDLNAAGAGQFSVGIDRNQITNDGVYNVTLRLLTARANDTVVDYKDISLTLTVLTEPVIDQAALHFVAGDGISPSSQLIDIDGDPAITAWSASVIYDVGATGWLSLVTSSGTTLPGTVTVNVSSMGSGTYRARVRLNFDGIDVDIPVVFFVHDHAVNFISPNVAHAGNGGDAIIRGYGFSTLTSPTVKFDTTDAASVTVVSDTEIRATYPVLTAGNYDVNVSDMSMALTTSAELHVIAPPAFTGAVIPAVNTGYGPYSGSLAYDEVDETLYLRRDTTTSTDYLEKYSFNGATWDTGSLTLNSSFGGTGVALTPDGEQLLLPNTGAMVHIDLATFTVNDTVSTSTDLGVSSMGRLAMLNDGAVIGDYSPQNAEGYLYRYEVDKKSFARIATEFELRNYLISSPLDGSEAVMLSFASTVTSWPVYRYDSSDYVYEAVPGLMMDSIDGFSLSRDGAKRLLHDFGSFEIVDDTYTTLGTLVPAGVTLDVFDSAIISQDGDRAYVFDDSTNKLHTFDLTNKNAQNEFAEIGSGVALAGDPGSGAEAMLITADGGNLFIAGTDNVIVVDLP